MAQQALEEQDWAHANHLMESDGVVEARIIGFNKGGVLTRIGRVRGFLPASQLTISRQLRQSNGAEEILQKYVGKHVHAKVIEVDRSRNRLILSERAAQKEVRAAKRAALLEELNEGDVLEGTVVNVAAFGAFIDIGGIEGLVHISELSWKRNVKPLDVVNIGDDVEVFVLGVDQKRQRIALSLKHMEPDPWETVLERYQVGQLVEVSITKLTDYGAFARLNDDEYNFEGLIHISEIAEDHIKHPNQVLHKSEVVTARIIRIDPEKKQIGLSLKQVTSQRFMEADLAMASSNDDVSFGNTPWDEEE